MFRASGKQVIEVAPPPRRVLACAEPLAFGSIKNALDPATKARGCHMFTLPYWGEDAQNVGCLDRSNRHVPERSRIRLQRLSPLTPVLFIPKPV
jgi:hypothetical protein